MRLRDIEEFLFAIFVAACYTTSNFTTVEQSDGKFQLLRGNLQVKDHTEEVLNLKNDILNQKYFLKIYFFSEIRAFGKSIKLETESVVNTMENFAILSIITSNFRKVN